MGPPSLLIMLMAVAMAAGTHSDSKENELDYAQWNYRDGAESVNVASLHSVTRVLDAWGKRIFNEIKTLLHTEPGTLLPDYSRVRPLSESLNDLFREVSLLRTRITELSQRLATVEPFLRHYGYRKEEKEEKEEKEKAGGGRAQGMREEAASQVRYSRRPGPRLVRIRGRPLKYGVVGRVHRARDSH